MEQVDVAGSVATCLGRDVATGERVAFYAEHRAAAAIAAAVADAGEVDALPVADVEPWQVAGHGGPS